MRRNAKEYNIYHDKHYETVYIRIMKERLINILHQDCILCSTSILTPPPPPLLQQNKTKIYTTLQVYILKNN